MTTPPNILDVRDLKGANLGLAFLLELAGLVAAAYWGYTTGGGARYALAIAAPLVVGIVWGLVAAPRSRIDVSTRAKYVIAPSVLLACAAALAVAGRPVIAAVYAILVVVNGALGALWNQRATPP